MTLQDQLVEAGLVGEEARDKLAAEARSRDTIAPVLRTLRGLRFVSRVDLATLLPPELAQYHKELRDGRFYVVSVKGGCVRFAQRPQRSYIAYCYAARRRFDRARAREGGQQCVR